MATAILMPLEAEVQYEKKMKAVREGRVTVSSRQCVRVG
jgi:hypothetical protein